MKSMNRREFLSRSLVSASVAGVAAQGASLGVASAATRMRFGLVTYLWGEKWDLSMLIQNCEASDVLGVELRTTHAHGVERELTKKQRGEVAKRFADSQVTHVGIGSNENFDAPSARKLARSIEATKEFILLSHDTGGSGVKVKPNSFHEGVDHQVTIEQIGKSLNELGAFGADHGQEIRLEVHGQCQRLPIIKEIMDIADHPNVAVCWNSNAEDLLDGGLESNFDLVKGRFGATAHVREFNVGVYPYAELMKLFVGMDYDGWVLMEARTRPEDGIAALIEQREVFETLTS
ncbi:MAG: TIM barrel protein [Candidatus Hydrogenedentota bacterium]